MKPDVVTKELYLPNTSSWFDFYTGQEYAGGQTIEVDVNMETIPTFVRAGSIIPMSKPMQTTKEYDGNTLEIHYYYDGSEEGASFSMYNDDGLSFDSYSNQEFELLHFNITNVDDEITVVFSVETAENFSTSKKNIELIIHNLEGSIFVIEAPGEEVTVSIDTQNKTVKIPIVWNTESTEMVKVSF